MYSPGAKYVIDALRKRAKIYTRKIQSLVLALASAAVAGFVGIEFLECCAAAEFDAVLIVDGQDFDLHGVAHLADVGDAVDVFVGQFADVAESVFSGDDFHEGPEVLDAGHAAVVDFADFDGGGEGLDLGHGFFAPSILLQATVTVPSSSTSITAPVESWMERIILPPGPISRPIFSGSMRVRRGAGPGAEISGRGRLMSVSMVRRISIRASRAWMSVFLHDLFVDAVDLEIQLDAGDAVLRAGDLKSMSP